MLNFLGKDALLAATNLWFFRLILVTFAPQQTHWIQHTDNNYQPPAMPLADSLIPRRLYDFLTPTQEVVLYMVTFMGRYKDNNLIDEKIMQYFSISKDELTDSFRVLSDRKLLSFSRDNIRGLCRTFTGLFFRHAIHIIKYNPAIQTVLEKVLWTEQSSNATFLWSLSKKLVKGELTSDIWQPLDVTLGSEDWFYALKGYIFDERLHPLFIHLPKRTFRDVITLYLSDCFMAGTYSEKLFFRLGTLIDDRPSLPPQDASALRDHIALYGWLCLGHDFPAPHNADDNPWRRMAQSIRGLYRGEDVNFLEERDPGGNNYSDHQKTIPLYDPICAFFIAVSQEKKTSLSEREELPLLISGMDPRKERERGLIQDLWDILSEHGMSDERRKARIRTLYLTLGSSVGGRRYCMLLSRYFGYSDLLEQFSPPPSSREQLPPFLELEYTSVIGARVPDELSSKIGPAGILASIKRMEVWESTLSDISSIIDENTFEDSADGNGEEGSDGRPSSFRFIYVIHESGSFEVRSQSRAAGKGEEFKGLGTHLDTGDFCALGALSGLDLEIASRLKAFRRVSVDATEVLPLLVRSDRVFTEKERKLMPLQVRTDVPYLEVKEKDGAFLALSNIAHSNIWKKNERNVFLLDGNRITVIGATPLQRELVSKFLSRGIYPLAAAPVLRETLRKLSRILEVRSDLLSDLTDADIPQGDSRLYLQLTPGKDSSFILEAMVRPLEEEDEAFSPAEGPAIVHMGSAQRRLKVRRDILRERKNLSLLVEFLSGKSAVPCPGADAFRQEVTGSPLYELPAQTVLALLEWCPAHEEDIVVRWPKGGKIELLGNLDKEDVNLRISSRENWFEVEGEVNLGDGNTLPLSMLLNILGEEKGRGSKYIRLSSKQYLNLASSLRRQLKELEAISEEGREGARIPKLRIGALSRIIHSGELTAQADSSLSDLEKRIQDSESLCAPIPSELNATLRDYQVDGYRWMVKLDSWGAGACLGDDMGLGKTLQTIAFLLHKKEQGASLVIAPASVILNWRNELGKFSPTLGVRVLNAATDRAEAIRGAGPGDVVITTYGLLGSEIDLLSSRTWNVTVLDEAHIIRNRRTKTSEAAMRLSSASRIILTGTPVQNYLGELWNLFQFLNPGLLGSYEKFHAKFIVPIQQHQDSERSEQLRKIVQPFMLRRTKAEVIDELPDKTEVIRYVSFTPEEMLLYEDMREKARTAIAGARKVNMRLLSDITKLRQCACSATLVRDGWIGATSKVEAFSELIGEILEGGNKVLVFSQFTSFLSLCKEALDKSGIPYFYLDGATPIGKREQMVRSFQEGGQGNAGVFMISLMAGGLGLNLTAANYVIHLDPWWNPAAEQQATDRAYRIGQRQSVTVYHLISQNTIEEKILRLHKTKQDIADSILSGTDKSHALTIEDLQGLVEK